jgi:hypothetical protein
MAVYLTLMEIVLASLPHDIIEILLKVALNNINIKP